MRGYPANDGNLTARCGPPGHAQQDMDTTQDAFDVGPPMMGHPKRTRSMRSGAKRVSPPSAESYGGPIMLPLSNLRYHQVTPNLQLVSNTSFRMGWLVSNNRGICVPVHQHRVHLCRCTQPHLRNLSVARDWKGTPLLCSKIFCAGLVPKRRSI